MSKIQHTESKCKTTTIIIFSRFIFSICILIWLKWIINLSLSENYCERWYGRLERLPETVLPSSIMSWQEQQTLCNKEALFPVVKPVAKNINNQLHYEFFFPANNSDNKISSPYHDMISTVTHLRSWNIILINHSYRTTYNNQNQ